MLYTLFLTISAVVPLVYVILKLYAKVTARWCNSQTCLVGKTAIVTGSNRGVGFEIALDFAKRGARVILACRDEIGTEEARARIIEETGNENVVIKFIDITSFDSVRAFAKEINESEGRLDIFVNNVGTGSIGDLRTKDGHSLVTQINHFSSFLLTHLLIDLMKKTKQSRIVNVSSEAVKHGPDIDKTDAFAEIWQIYKHSKLCNILFTIELARRLADTSVTTYSVHLENVKTEILRHSKTSLKLYIAMFKNLFAKTSEEAAQTTMYCALAKGIETYNGEHFNDCRKVEPYKIGSAPELSQKLWELTQDFVQLKPEEIVI